MKQLTQLRLRIKLFLGVGLITAFACYLFFYYYKDQIKPAAQQATEDVLVESANLLAILISDEINTIPNYQQLSLEQQGKINVLEGTVKLRKLPIYATIWNKKKKQSNLHIYMTNKNGIVIFDSNEQIVGEDYSKWNDVFLTLRGYYGVRSSKITPDSVYSIMYVGAPIKDKYNQTIGVVSVGKPIAVLDTFIRLAEKKLKQYAVYIFLFASLLTALYAWWFVREIKRVENYATAIAKADKVALPKVSSQEMLALVEAIRSLKQELDGKAYIEHYAQTLSHELKSPLAGIKASAELLESEDLPIEISQQFLGMIQQENERAICLVERLLELTRLENQTELVKKDKIDIQVFFKEIQQDILNKSIQANVSVKFLIREVSHTFDADLLLLKQAIINLINNAIDFSPENGTVYVSATLIETHHQHNKNHNQMVRHISFYVEDEGGGIPDYAQHRIFERFYSLARPTTGKKSSGLGLSIVKQIALLHGGDVHYFVSKHGGAGFCMTIQINNYHQK